MISRVFVFGVEHFSKKVCNGSMLYINRSTLETTRAIVCQWFVSDLGHLLFQTPYVSKTYKLSVS